MEFPLTSIFFFVVTAGNVVSSQILDSSLKCKDNEVLCGDESQCIPVYSVCDFTYDCEDQSDEELSICKKVQSLKSDCSAGNIKCLQSQTCMDLNAACLSQSTCITNSTTFSELCMDIQAKRLLPNYGACSTKNNTLKIIEYLASAFNGTKNGNFSKDSCPPLYVRVGKRCISFFTPAEIVWNEAKVFCESISGKLIKVDTAAGFGELLTYIKKNDIKSKFWIGGQYGYRNARTAWIWLDGTFMEMGAPFWSVYFANNCTTVQPPPMDCKSFYSVMPRKNEVGNCVSINTDYFYYFSDENCYAKKSPICLYNKS